MKRRQFIFRTAQSMLFLSPIFSIRRAMAQADTIKKVRPVFFIDGGSPYPYPQDFFPSQSGTDFSLPPIIQDFKNVKSDMIILDGINLSSSGPNIKGNWHVSAMGKVLTAHQVHQIPDTFDGLPGGPSVDQVIAKALGVNSLEVQVHTKDYNAMRGRPFAVGNREFKIPISNPASAWDKVFKNFQPDELTGDSTAAKAERLARLSADKSILDSMVSELKRFRRELTGEEKVKLDIHENSIRKAEQSLAAEIELQNSELKTSASCSLPTRNSQTYIPTRSQAHFDVMFAALACERIGVGGVMFGYSSIQWGYEWLGFNLNDDVHDAVYHRASAERSNFIKAARWNWQRLALFAERLKATPDGQGNMLDSVLLYGTSHFGLHHTVTRTPVILIGSAQKQLKTGQSLKVSSFNDKVLTSVANLCGVKINGIGDNLSCGQLKELGIF